MKHLRPDLPALTGLRFFAALAIVLDHLWPVIFKLNPGVPFADPFHQLAFLGMSLFFALSGFIILFNYADSIGSVRGLCGFAIARFSRLYPLFIALVAYDLVCGNFFLYQPSEQPHFIAALPYMVTATQSWLYGFVGNHPITFPYHFSDVTWSISTEFFLYLTFPILSLCALRVAGRRAAIGAVAVTVGATLILSWLRSHTAGIDHFGALLGIVENPQSDPAMRFSDWFNYQAPYARVLEFSTGIMLARLHSALALRPVSSQEQWAATAAAALATMNIAAFILRGELGLPGVAHALSAVGLLPAISVLIFYCARYEAKALSGVRIVALGEASYSIYLLHLIVIERSAPTSFVDATPLNTAILAGRTIIILIVIAVLSLGIHRYFERPAQKWIRGLSKRFSLPGSVAFERLGNPDAKLTNESNK